MLDKSEKKSILSKISSSKTFINSGNYSELLEYLVQCEIDEVPVKEYSIGTEVLNKNKNFDPNNDPTVRSYMHRLRNKLKSYYEDEGRKDKIRITIPKGHYELKFSNQSFSKRYLFRKHFAIYLVLISIIILLLTYFIFVPNYFSFSPDSIVESKSYISKDDPIWNDFFKNNLPNIIVIGDHFQFLEINNDSTQIRQIIDFSINTLEDFENLLKVNHDRKFFKGLHGGIPTNAVWNIYDLSNVFFSFHQKLNIEFSSLFIASQFDLTNLENRNIIYVGGFRNLRELSSILKTLPIKYKYTDLFKGELQIRENKTDSLITFRAKKLDKQFHQDIGLVIKLSGQNNENYIFFLGFAFPAQIETVRLLSKNDKLTNLYSQLNLNESSVPKQFFLVMEILCTDFSAIEVKVKHFQALP